MLTTGKRLSMFFATTLLLVLFLPAFHFLGFRGGKTGLHYLCTLHALLSHFLSLTGLLSGGKSVLRNLSAVLDIEMRQ
ncbi:MAG: hypothetical protein LBT15_06715, partial [Synergistaceae bacterium]|nr:hypothetical protein [Synergistaceae bacterium]